MMRLFFAITLVIASIAPAIGKMDTETRRDFIAACMFSGGFSVTGRQPPVVDRDGHVDIERTVKSWVDTFQSDDKKLEAGREIRKCLQQLLDAESGNQRTSRVVPRDSYYVELALRADPFEYAKGVLCTNTEIRHNLTVSYQLRKFSGGLDQSTKEGIDSLVSQLANVNMQDPLKRALYTLNPDEVDCTIERICQIRGSVPVELMTSTMKVLDIPMRQVRVLAGTCESKVGFVNERFIDF